MFTQSQAEGEFLLEKRLAPKQWKMQGIGELMSGPVIELERGVIVAGWVTTAVEAITTHGKYIIFKTRNSIYRLSPVRRAREV
jgi:hypothetical protein